MGRAQSSIVIFIRQSISTQIRKFSGVTRELEFNGEGVQPTENEELAHSVEQPLTDMAREVAKIIRTKPKWEETILSDFPAFIFTEPRFFDELMKQQDNALLSLHFFKWLRSHSNFIPDPDSCNVLFNSLLEAKAGSAAKHFLEVSNFSPELDDLERYVCCLSESGLVEDAFEVFSVFKAVGQCPSIKIWNAALLGCIKVERTDLVWKLYHDMLELGVVKKINIKTVEYLILAFCIDHQVQEGYQLLRQVLENGLVPRKTAFNALISEFSKQRNYDKVSELLHLMIAVNRAPNIYTYQEIINGLWKNNMSNEALRIFKDLKDRGYAPGTVTYTKMIHGLCGMGRVDDARNLWSEMIKRGIHLDEYTYNTLIDGLYKNGELEEASMLYDEMRGKGFGGSKISFNIVISNLCSHERVGEAFDLFQEMLQKGIVPDVISFDSLIRGFCREEKIEESKIILNELLAYGLQPTTYSFIPLIWELNKVGEINEAKQLWYDMHYKGLIPLACYYDNFICVLCERGDLTEGIEWLVVMLKNKRRPERTTLETLVQCLQYEKSDESLFVFTSLVGHFLKIGYDLLS